MKYALTCLAGPTAMGLVALAPDTASEARYYLGGCGADQGSAGAAGRTRVRHLCRPAPPLWRLCLSSSPLLLRSLLLWVWPAVEVPSPLLGLANTNFRLAKLSPSAHGPGGESV